MESVKTLEVYTDRLEEGPHGALSCRDYHYSVTAEADGYLLMQCLGSPNIFCKYDLSRRLRESLGHQGYDFHKLFVAAFTRVFPLMPPDNYCLSEKEVAAVVEGMSLNA